MSPDDHMPVRPDWTCMVCGHLWPCVDRRTALLAEHGSDRLSLLMYLASCLDDALTDLPRPSEAGDLDLYARFLGWARSAQSISVTRLVA
jgi:hypothetical protein